MKKTATAYARVLLEEFSVENPEQDYLLQVHSSLFALATEILEKEKSTFLFIQNTGLDRSFLEAFLEPFPGMWKNFIALLLKNKHLNLLLEIAGAYKQLLYKRLNKREMLIEHADKMLHQEKHIKKWLSEQVDADLEFIVIENPKLITGFVARCGSQVWDYSLSNQVHSLMALLNGKI
ncbi:MAG: F0F1 ATP synthase subunit delta [Gammaproteobacteria bacterium]